MHTTQTYTTLIVLGSEQGLRLHDIANMVCHGLGEYPINNITYASNGLLSLALPIYHFMQVIVSIFSIGKPDKNA